MEPFKWNLSAFRSDIFSTQPPGASLGVFLAYLTGTLGGGQMKPLTPNSLLSHEGYLTGWIIGNEDEMWGNLSTKFKCHKFKAC